MSNSRIVERIYLDGITTYVVQQRHFLFRWWWVDANLNSFDYVPDTFETFEEAKVAYDRLNKTNRKVIERVVYSGDSYER